jgi:tripartite-type tricarboxylate transporter receptor subunit TctC
MTTATRWEAPPDIPTVDEFAPSYEASSSYGLGAPKNTPPEIIERLNWEINAGLREPEQRDPRRRQPERQRIIPTPRSHRRSGHLGV